jgi:ribosomal protein L11 methyltransferase
MEIEEIDFRDRSLLDVGTGSGILALAAEGLGAAPVVGLDIDTMAAWEARHTAGRQDFESRLRVVAGPVDCLGPAVFDVVLCNMISSNFTPLLGNIVRLLAPEGVVIFSGILETERRSVEAALLDNGLVCVGGRRDGDWISLRSTPRAAAP